MDNDYIIRLGKKLIEKLEPIIYEEFSTLLFYVSFSTDECCQELNIGRDEYVFWNDYKLSGYLPLDIETLYNTFHAYIMSYSPKRFKALFDAQDKRKFKYFTPTKKQ